MRGRLLSVSGMLIVVNDLSARIVLLCCQAARLLVPNVYRLLKLNGVVHSPTWPRAVALVSHGAVGRRTSVGSQRIFYH